VELELQREWLAVHRRQHRPTSCSNRTRQEAVADRGYFNGEEIRVCEHAGIAVTLPKPMTFGAMAEGRFGKQDFAYNPDDDVYRRPTGETLKYYYTNVEDGLALSRYWTNAG
jgi:hypothetical protein